MALANRYDPKISELQLNEFWKSKNIFKFDLHGSGDVYSIDTPPPTVSGYLHLGHVYSYCHTDFTARFWRMRGKRVFYPMGFDDNGLPTERFVENKIKIKSSDLDRDEFIQKCLDLSIEVENTYRILWEALGLSIDWEYTYRTIGEESRKIAQWSFIDLYQKGYVYRQEAPAIWCPECKASFAQADLNDLERDSEFITLEFTSDQGGVLPVSTTRPELLGACVAVFIHPSDKRYQEMIGQKVRVPLYEHQVPVLVDPGADPEKGTGAVMCCTFGDSVDVHWWRSHGLPFVKLISENGRLTDLAGPLAGLELADARKKIKNLLENSRLIRDRVSTIQSVRVHERCDTPVEYLMVKQWFVRLLDYKDELLELGRQLNWFPEHMRGRYLAWVENLGWDWCISRQRNFGVPFPLWYCKDCNEVIVSNLTDLPVDPVVEEPNLTCPKCGSAEFEPERDVFDTWMTSSNSPQIVGGWQNDLSLYEQVFPFSLRPHAHEIIRTWTFYSVVKSYFHFKRLPWQDIAISGWAIAGEGMEKISKSRGGGPVSPQKMIEMYSADALRYWASSTSPGKDAVISEEKIRSGTRFVNKLWNVARFAERFLNNASATSRIQPDRLSPADRWILARQQSVIQRTTSAMLNYDYATAKNELESFFWHDLADNYLEMVKQRLYDETDPLRAGAVCTLQEVLFTLIKLLAPFFPYITEEIYQNLFMEMDGNVSIHSAKWPEPNASYMDPEDETFGEILLTVAGAVRRFKSQHNLPLGKELSRLQLATAELNLRTKLQEAEVDLKSITRAKTISFVEDLENNIEVIEAEGAIKIGLSE